MFEKPSTSHKMKTFSQLYTAENTLRHKTIHNAYYKKKCQKEKKNIIVQPLHLNYNI